jgi:hypothetical protein
LQQRFGELGPIAVQFLDGLLAKQTYGKMQAQQLLALVAHYQRDDVLKALERAVRFGAFSLAAVRRIFGGARQTETDVGGTCRAAQRHARSESTRGTDRPTSDQRLPTPTLTRKPMSRRPKKNPKTTPTLRDQILADFTTLRVPVTAEQLDEVLKQAQDAG